VSPWQKRHVYTRLECRSTSGNGRSCKSGEKCLDRSLLCHGSYGAMAVKHQYELRPTGTLSERAEARIDETLALVVQTVAPEDARALAASWLAYRQTTKHYNACLQAFVAADDRGDRTAAMHALREALSLLDERLTLSVALNADTAPVRRAVDQLLQLAGLLEALEYPSAAHAREKALALRVAAGSARTRH
jgi:hypothetical protein